MKKIALIILLLAAPTWAVTDTTKWVTTAPLDSVSVYEGYSYASKCSCTVGGTLDSLGVEAFSSTLETSADYRLAIYKYIDADSATFLDSTLHGTANLSSLNYIVADAYLNATVEAGSVYMIYIQGLVAGEQMRIRRKGTITGGLLWRGNGNPSEATAWPSWIAPTTVLTDYVMRGKMVYTEAGGEPGGARVRIRK